MLEIIEGLSYCDLRKVSLNRGKALIFWLKQKFPQITEELSLLFKEYSLDYRGALIFWFTEYSFKS